MKNLRNKEQLLREYVRTILKEEESYATLLDASISQSPFGMHYGSRTDLYNTFIKPFVDIYKTAEGETKELARRVQTAVQVVFNVVKTTLIPWTKDNYEDIFNKQKEDIDAIRSEYADVVKSSWDALTSSDATLIAFLASPGSVMSAAVLKKTPDVARNLLDVVSGGKFNQLLAKWGVGSKARSSSRPDPGGYEGGSVGGVGGAFESFSRSHPLLLEKKKKKPGLTDILSSKKIVNKMLDNPRVNKMQSDATQVIKNTLSQIYEQVNTFCKTKSIKELEKALGKKIEGLSDESIKGAEKEVFKMLKDSIKTLYIGKMKSQIQEVRNAGFDDSSTFIKLYSAAIAEIEKSCS
jgi:hypothetical protein